MILMKHGSFQGEAAAPDYAGWCVLRSLGWGCAQRHGVPAAGNRTASAADLRALTATIGPTPAAAMLLREALVGAPQTVEVHVTAWVGKDKLEPRTTFKLDRARVTHFAADTAADEESFSFTLAYASVTLGFATLLDQDGQVKRLRAGPDVYDVTR